MMNQLHHHARGCNTNAACASCKHQRKKCDERCLLSPYFPSQKSHEFQAVHKVFGVSNVTKMMAAAGDADKDRLVESLVCEALVRQRDPIGGMYGEYQKIMDEVLYLRSLTQGHVLQIQQLQAEIKRVTNGGGTGNDNLGGVCRVGGTPVAASPGLLGWNNSRGINPVANINPGRGGPVGAATNDVKVRSTHGHENESCIIDAVPFTFQMDRHLDMKNDNQGLASMAAVRPQGPPVAGFNQQYLQAARYKALGFPNR